MYLPEFLRKIHHQLGVHAMCWPIVNVSESKENGMGLEQVGWIDSWIRKVVKVKSFSGNRLIFFIQTSIVLRLLWRTCVRVCVHKDTKGVEKVWTVNVRFCETVLLLHQTHLRWDHCHEELCTTLTSRIMVSFLYKYHNRSNFHSKLHAFLPVVMERLGVHHFSSFILELMSWRLEWHKLWGFSSESQGRIRPMKVETVWPADSKRWEKGIL